LVGRAIRITAQLNDDGSDGATLVLTVHGDIESGAVAEVRRRLSRALEAGKRVLVVDLSEVEYIDTVAIAMLIDASDRAARARGRLVVVSPPDSRAAVLLSLTEADRLVAVEPTREAALGED
jgi:anti-sigma B factor antagonist